MSRPGRDAPSIAHVTIDRDGHALRWLANHDKNFRSSCLAGWVFSDAGLASGTAGLELVGAPGDANSVSAPGLAVLGVWDSEPGAAALGV